MALSTRHSLMVRLAPPLASLLTAPRGALPSRSVAVLTGCSSGDGAVGSFPPLTCVGSSHLGFRGFASSSSSSSERNHDSEGDTSSSASTSSGGGGGGGGEDVENENKSDTSILHDIIEEDELTPPPPPPRLISGGDADALFAGRSTWSPFQDSILARRPGGLSRKDGDGLALHRASEARASVARAMRFLSVTAARGGEIVFLGSMTEHRPLVRAAARACDQHSLTKWTGGLLTNWNVTKKRIEMLRQLAKLPPQVRRWYEKNPKNMPQYHRMNNGVGGMKNLLRKPDVLVITDPQWQSTALKEAMQESLPVVALVDAAVDARKIAYSIAGISHDLENVHRFLELCALAIKQARTQTGASKRSVDGGSQEENGERVGDDDDDDGSDDLEREEMRE
ncbi:ribosomal protein S2 [Pseudoscourfieldia marina]